MSAPELTAMQNRILELETAILPFAKLAGAFARRPASAPVASTAVGEITVADLRAARRALQSGGRNGGEAAQSAAA